MAEFDPRDIPYLSRGVRPPSDVSVAVPRRKPDRSYFMNMLLGGNPLFPGESGAPAVNEFIRGVGENPNQRLGGGLGRAYGTAYDLRNDAIKQARSFGFDETDYGRKPAPWRAGTEPPVPEATQTATEPPSMRAAIAEAYAKQDELEAARLAAAQARRQAEARADEEDRRSWSTPIPQDNPLALPSGYRAPGYEGVRISRGGQGQIADQRSPAHRLSQYGPGSSVVSSTGGMTYPPTNWESLRPVPVDVRQWAPPRPIIDREAIAARAEAQLRALRGETEARRFPTAQISEQVAGLVDEALLAAIDYLREDGDLVRLNLLPGMEGVVSQGGGTIGQQRASLIAELKEEANRRGLITLPDPTRIDTSQGRVPVEDFVGGAPIVPEDVGKHVSRLPLPVPRPRDVGGITEQGGSADPQVAVAAALDRNFDRYRGTGIDDASTVPADPTDPVDARPAGVLSKFKDIAGGALGVLGRGARNWLETPDSGELGLLGAYLMEAGAPTTDPAESNRIFTEGLLKYHELKRQGRTDAVAAEKAQLEMDELRRDARDDENWANLFTRGPDEDTPLEFLGMPPDLIDLLSTLSREDGVKLIEEWMDSQGADLTAPVVMYDKGGTQIGTRAINKTTGKPTFTLMDGTSLTEAQVLERWPGGLVPENVAFSARSVLSANQFLEETRELAQERSSINQLQKFLSTHETLDAGIAKWTDNIIGEMKTVLGVKRLNNEDYSLALANAQQQGLIGKLREAIVGPGVMTEKDAERITAALGGAVTDLTTRHQVVEITIKDLIRNKVAEYNARVPSYNYQAGATARGNIPKLRTIKPKWAYDPEKPARGQSTEALEHALQNDILYNINDVRRQEIEDALRSWSDEELQDRVFTEEEVMSMDLSTLQKIRERANNDKELGGLVAKRLRELID